MSEAWFSEAACLGQRTNLFFTDDAAGEDGYNEVAVKAAKVFCRHCTVVEQCKQFAIDNDMEGIWGGMTRRERARHAAAQRRDDLAALAEMTSHGTERDYQKHLRLNTVPCADCRRAHARYVADIRRRRAEAKVG